MSSQEKLPTLTDFLSAYEGSIRGEKGADLDVRRGSGLDLVGGSSAILWARQALRDRGNFRGCYPDTASGADLDRQVRVRYGVERVRASRGVGHALLGRPSAAAGEGVIDAGARIEARTLAGDVEIYRVARDTPMEASALTVRVPVEAVRTGVGVAISASGPRVRLADMLFDASLSTLSLVCADGTEDESPGAYLARGRTRKRELRKGYARAIENACRSAGAENIVLFTPDAFGTSNDQGIANIYVADAYYASTPALLDACAVAVDSARVAGVDVQILGMAVVPVSLIVLVSLWDQVSKFDLVDLRGAIVASLLASFASRDKFWLFSHGSLEGAAFDACRGAARSVFVAASPAAPTPGFVPVLPRYTLAGTAIKIDFEGP